MLPESSPVLNAIHQYMSKQIRPTAKIDGEPYFTLDF